MRSRKVSVELVRIVESFRRGLIQKHEMLAWNW